jgi:signal transduction histidine kinase
MTTPLTPEVLVPRLGEYLVQNGTISKDDLKKALTYQKKKQKVGKYCLLGQALLDLNLLDRQQLDHAVTEQIIQLRNALEDANRFLEHRVTERTSELQGALQKLSELSQTKANFVANISHELRTPLTHIKGYLELLVTGSLGPLSEGQNSALHVSQKAAGQLESLINNLIMFSQSERGEITLHLAPLDVTKLAGNVIDNSRDKASNHNVTLDLETSDNLPLVQVDAEKINWVLYQLVDNAIKFTSSGGSVRIGIHPESGNLIMVSVIDTGIGIPANRLEEIFEPFHQLDGSPSRRYGGTGLGLALVRDILNAHGSFIEVESEEGKGSIFRFPLLSTITGKE